MAVKFELKSAFSAKVSWDAVAAGDAGSSTPYTVQWSQGSVVKEAARATPSIVLVNLDPETSYDVRVLSGTGTTADATFSGAFTTWPAEDPTWKTCTPVFA
ncbi:unnamed protein product [Ectocarpus sp. 12 AP-2014]